MPEIIVGWIIRAFHLANETNGNVEFERQICLRKTTCFPPFPDFLDHIVV
jgi:hypothetical protein